MRQIKVTIILSVLFIVFPLNGHTQTHKFGDTAVINPEYNIVIWNLTNDSVKNIIVTYGDETFNINQIDSHMFKMRNFVDYKIPETVIFQWQDGNGKNYRKELPVPDHKLHVDFLSSLFFSFIEGNTVSIEWKGYEDEQTPPDDKSTIINAVKAAESKLEMLIELFSAKGVYLTSDEDGNELCYQYIDPQDDSNCATLGEVNTKTGYYKTLEDIIDIVLFLYNTVDKEVSPYNSKPLFTKEADAAGQIAILKAGKLEVKIVAYDNDRNIISEVNVKGN